MSRKIPSNPHSSAPSRRSRTGQARQSGDLWTSAEAAAALRVGVSSIKRWTDAGELESVLTPGSHRRYTLASLHRFAAARMIPADLLPPIAQDLPAVGKILLPGLTLFQALKGGDAASVRRLVEPRVNSIAQRAAFLDQVVGEALRSIGEQWASGQLSIEEEHRASYVLADAIDRLRPAMVAGGNVAILACPPGEWHEMPLRLVRLVLEWHGWRTEFVGASLPWNEAAASARRRHAVLLAFSARSQEAFDDDAFLDLVRRCQKSRIQVVAGGEWARGGSGAEVLYQRFRTLHGFERWLRSAYPAD